MSQADPLSSPSLQMDKIKLHICILVEINNLPLPDQTEIPANLMIGYLLFLHNL